MKKLYVINRLDLVSYVTKLREHLPKNIGFLIGVILAFAVSELLNITLVLPVFLTLLAGFLKILYKDLKQQTFNLANLTLLFEIVFVVAIFLSNAGLSIFLLPFCTVPMLATLLFSEPVIALLLSLASSVAVSVIANNNATIGMLFFISGLLSILLVYSTRKRATIIRAGFIIGLVQALSLFFINNFQFETVKPYFILLINGIVCGIIVLGVSPIFEYIFKTITNISLLELADFNHPLLNRMMLEAPGTYHHSLVVGNLSEAACSVVGANSLLARIGAYYHDIGKLQKPEYFSENQNLTGNKHDVLSPTMSKLVIMNHVKDGTEMARKSGLNPRIIDFIQFHHGSSLVYYFYRRALENPSENQEVKEEGFRYPGPKPNTKETAVVMLADSVEAAARTLRDPVPAKIGELVHKIINNKFIDGQLDECDLTLKDLEKISSVFIRILSGIYHTRVNYPDEKNQSSEK